MGLENFGTELNTRGEETENEVQAMHCRSGTMQEGGVEMWRRARRMKSERCEDRRKRGKKKWIMEGGREHVVSVRWSSLKLETSLRVALRRVGELEHDDRIASSLLTAC